MGKLEKISVSSEKYVLNKRAVLTVKNTPNEVLDSGKIVSYKVVATLKHTVVLEEPLSFKDEDAISDFICNIDLANDQLTLPGVE